MKKNARKTKTLALCMLVMLLVPLAGCFEVITATSAMSFSAGWLVGRVTAPTITQTQCFVNGVEVDCGSLP